MSKPTPEIIETIISLIDGLDHLPTLDEVSEYAIARRAVVLSQRRLRDSKVSEATTSRLTKTLPGTAMRHS